MKLDKALGFRTLAVAVSWCVLSAAAVSAADLVLAENGKTGYEIVLPAAPPTPEIGTALEQTARLVQTAFLANGVAIGVVSEDQRDPAKPGLFLGDTAHARQHGIDAATLPGWGYVHKVVGRDLLIVGHDHAAPFRTGGARARNWDRLGTVKGAADFLRTYAGTRFLYPDLGPWAPVAKAASIDLLHSPAFEFLETPVIAVPDDLDVRHEPLLEYNFGYPYRGSFYDIANNRFPLVDTIFGCHTYARAIPVQEYRAEHPKYFALVGGKRVEHGQYCISNPEVQELLYQDMVSWIERGFDTVDLGQPDGFQPCQCEECKKLFDTGADWSEKLWILHRNLAARVLESHPTKKVALMAYAVTETPPKTFKTFPPNTKLMLCGTNEDDIAKWRDYEIPAGFTGYVYNWCANLSSRYTPMRTPRYIEAQVQRLYRNRVRGLHRDGTGDQFGLEGPVYYIMGRLFDDPEQLQAKALMFEFCGAAFGRGGSAMRTFYDRLYHGIELYAEYLGTRCPGWSYTDIYGRGRKHLQDPFQLLGFLYTPPLLKALEADLARAEKAADTDKVRARLALVRREFDYLKALAKVVHLYQAYELEPDLVSRARLLDAIDARNALIASFYGRGALPHGEGWAFVMFPPGGHDANHLRLAYNRYQGPFKDTCLNWDTQAMRAAPLPGAKRVSVPRVAGPVTTDAPAWATAPECALSGVVPGAELSRRTALRLLCTGTALHLRAESELAPGQADFPELGRDGDLRVQEALDIYLAPVPGQEIFYRFTVGPAATAKYDAACGLITDVMDPRYGRDDPVWNGEWEYQTRIDTTRNMWIAMLTIPFATLGVDPPAPGVFWRGNFGRRHVPGPGRLESALWSVAPNTRDLDDRNAFGEIVFADSSGALPKAEVEKNPIQALREELYRTSFARPPAWKDVPDPLPQPLGSWQFRADPLEVGVKEQWFARELEAKGWVRVQVPSFWAENPEVGDYQGDGWYRVTFTVPEAWRGRPVRLLFGAADEQAWVYVNGALVREHTEASEAKSINALWETPFAADVAPENLAYGKENVLAVRVRNSKANGGLWRPVVGHAVPAK